MTDEVSEAYASDSVKRSISKCSYQPKKAGKDGYVMNRPICTFKLLPIRCLKTLVL